MPVIRSDDFTEPPFPPVADEPSPPRSAFQIRSILGALSPPLAAADGNKLWDLASAWCSLRVCESIDLGEHGTVDFASAHSLPSPNVPFHCSKKRRISREINLFTNSQACNLSSGPATGCKPVLRRPMLRSPGRIVATGIHQYSARTTAGVGDQTIVVLSRRNARLPCQLATHILKGDW